MLETLNNDTILDGDKRLVKRAVQALWQPRFWSQPDEFNAYFSDWYSYSSCFELEITQPMSQRLTFLLYYNHNLVGYVNNFFESRIINHVSIIVTSSMNHYRDCVAELVEEIAANS